MRTDTTDPSIWSPAAHLQTSEPGLYCDRREWSSGIRRRSTHLFSQRSPGDVGQDEQDNVSCRSVKHYLEVLVVSHTAHLKQSTCQQSCCCCCCCCCRCTGRPSERERQRKADSPSSKDKDRASRLSASGSCIETTFWHQECCCVVTEGHLENNWKKKLMKRVPCC